MTDVTDIPAAKLMVGLLRERPIAWIAIAVSHDGPQVKHAADPRAIRPRSLVIVAVEANTAVTRYCFTIDLRQQGLLSAVRDVLRQPIQFVTYGAMETMPVLWTLGLEEPRQLWDLRVAEHALVLGRFNSRYALRHDADDIEQARAAAQTDAQLEEHLSWPATCRRRGVSLQYPSLGAPAAVADIVAACMAAAEVYRHQLLDAVAAGALDHLLRIEMPWSVTNARIYWNGVRIDEGRRRRLADAASKYQPIIEARITEFGLLNLRNHAEVADYFDKLGLLDAFRKGGQITFEKDRIKEMAHLHPVLPLIYEARKAESLTKDKLLLNVNTSDGRVHPVHCQLGADSGRNSCRNPNLLGIDRTIRPLIVPDAGHGIGEVDLCQIEIGVAAAMANDPTLIEMYNTGDVYSAMAQVFFEQDLSTEDRHLPPLEFKLKHKAKRNEIKTCILGIIYGLTPEGLAWKLGRPTAECEKLLRRFRQMFPVLNETMNEFAELGFRRGYAATFSGLRRYRHGSIDRPVWERNWLRNHPIQGSACDAFKLAGNRLDKLYQQFKARLIVPVHDAFVFEAPLPLLSEVADLTARTMCESVRELFPQLRPRAEINIADPSCWNKDGNAYALDKWIMAANAVVAEYHRNSGPSKPPPSQ